MSRATSRARPRGDDGSTLPLIAAFCALGLALVLLVGAASSLYLERKRLFTLADGAALVGAEAFELSQVTREGTRIHPHLRSGDVRSAVEGYLAAGGHDEFEGLELEEAGSVDGLTATVTVSAWWRPPVLTIFVPEGLRVEATATARSVFG